MTTLTEERVGRQRVRFDESANITRTFSSNNEIAVEDEDEHPASLFEKINSINWEDSPKVTFKARHPDLHPLNPPKNEIMTSPLDKPPPTDLRSLLMEIRDDLRKAKGLHASFNQGLGNIVTPIPYPETGATPTASNSESSTCRCGASAPTETTPIENNKENIGFDPVATEIADASDSTSTDSDSLLSKPDALSAEDTDASSIESSSVADEKENRAQAPFKELTTAEPLDSTDGIAAEAGNDGVKRKTSLRKHLEKTRGVLHKITDKIHK